MRKPATVGKTREREVIAIGRHRVMCGDARAIDDVRRLFGRSRAALVVTSPPYFNQRDYAAWHSYEDYLDDVGRVMTAVLQVAGAPFVCCWNVGDSVKDHRDIPADHSLMWRRRGMTYRDKIAWVKPQPTYSVPRYRHIARRRYFPALQWETVLVFTRDGCPVFEPEDVAFWRKNDSNVWQIPPVPAPTQKRIGHPAVFPKELAARCIRAYSKKGDIVFDPFLGSGTTMVAAAELGRRCFGMERCAEYVTLAADRCRAARDSRTRRRNLA